MDKSDYLLVGFLLGIFVCGILIAVFDQEKRLNLRLDGYCQAKGFTDAKELDKKNERVRCVSENGFSWENYKLNN